jgi:serine/threonine protein kinase
MGEEVRLGKYVLIKELGRGGYGVVYEAIDTVLGRKVALKVLHPNLVNDLAFVNRFRHEAMLASQLDHPNIVPIYDFNQQGGHLFIAMGLMERGSLKDYLNTYGAMAPSQVKTLLEQVANGIGYAHEHDIIHRDLKPGNILIDNKGIARVADFGFAKALSGNSMSMSVSGGMLGTPAYMAPEVWEGKPATPASDIYSLGCIAYEILSGNQLFDGETPAQIMHAHLVRGPIPLEDAPPVWQDMLKRCLDRNPSQRYPSANALLEDLRWGTFEAYQPRTTEYIIEQKELEVQSTQPYSETNKPSNHISVENTSNPHYFPVGQALEYSQYSFPTKSQQPKQSIIKWLIGAALLAFITFVFLSFFYIKNKALLNTKPQAPKEEAEISNTHVNSMIASATKTPIPIIEATNTPISPSHTDIPRLNLGSSVLNQTNISDIQVLGTIHVSDNWINEIKFSTKGSKIAVSVEEGIFIYDSYQLNLLTEFTECQYGGQIDWLPDTDALTIGCNDGRIRMINGDDGEEFMTQYTLPDYEYAITDLEWSPDKRHLGLAMNNGMLTIINSDYPITPYHVIQAHDENERTEAVAWSPDSATLATIGDYRIRLWDADTGDEIDTHLWTRYMSMAWSPDGKWIVAGDIGGGMNLHEASGVNSYKSLPGHDINVFALEWSPDSSLLVSAASEDRIRFWNPVTQKLLFEFSTDDGARNLAWSSDGKTIAVGLWNGDVILLGIP